jgi:hypothetical protein
MNAIAAIAAGLAEGRLAPYLGPAALLLEPANAWLPVRAETLAERLSKRCPVPARLRRNLSGAAQYIENFRHRRTLRSLLRECFLQPALPTRLHHLLAALPLPLIVDTGYDTATAQALAAHRDAGEWGEVQGVSRADSRSDRWVQAYSADGTPVTDDMAAGWPTLLYKPLGAVLPAGNFLVSDADFVEVLTEIDIQTPIPEALRARREKLGFLFLGCRFTDQLTRSYARQVMKRSCGPHFAVIDGTTTRNEQRFLAEQGIERLDCTLEAFAGQLCSAVATAITPATTDSTPAPTAAAPAAPAAAASAARPGAVATT